MNETLSFYLTATFITGAALGILFLIGHYGFILFCHLFGHFDNWLHKDL